MSKRENDLVRTGMELLWMSERYRKTLVKIQKSMTIRKLTT